MGWDQLWGSWRYVLFGCFISYLYFLFESAWILHLVYHKCPLWVILDVLLRVIIDTFSICKIHTIIQCKTTEWLSEYYVVIDSFQSARCVIGQRWSNVLHWQHSCSILVIGRMLSIRIFLLSFFNYLLFLFLIFSSRWYSGAHFELIYKNFKNITIHKVIGIY